MGSNFRNATRDCSSSREKKIISDSDDDSPTLSSSSVVSHDRTTFSLTRSPTSAPGKAKDRKSGDRNQRRYVVTKIRTVAPLHERIGLPKNIGRHAGNPTEIPLSFTSFITSRCVMMDGCA